jgi:sarcosine oxidase
MENGGEVFDLAVVGAGVTGAATAWRASRRTEEAGHPTSVLLLERRAPAHPGGSSHGSSRIVRLTYDHADYVRLARESFGHWEELEREANECLLFRTGDVFFGPREGKIAAYPEALAAAGVAFEALGAAALGRRFPQLRVGEGDLAITQSESGLIAAERAVHAMARCAARRGARVETGVSVLGIDRAKDPIAIETSAGTRRARRVVLAGGAWMSKLLPELDLPLTVIRQEVFYFAPRPIDPFRLDRFPVWVYVGAEGPNDFFYGLPVFGPFGAKVARHVRLGAPADPDAPAPPPSAAGEADVRAFLDRRIPDAARAPLADAHGCLYTVTPDEDFIIDLHPGDPRVAIASACSGHGFKFGAVLGGALADLALEGRVRSAAFEAARRRFSVGRFTRAARAP